jgi:beta-phosphoglucomutase
MTINLRAKSPSFLTVETTFPITRAICIEYLPPHRPLPALILFTSGTWRFNLKIEPLSTDTEDHQLYDLFRAIIFDFNGVIIDDEPLHHELLRRVIIEENMTFADGDYEKYYLGQNDRACFVSALTRHARTESSDAAHVHSLIERKTGYYHEAIRSRNLLFPGIPELIIRLSQRYPLAVASGALRNEIEVALIGGGLRDHFELIIAAEDVERSKPDPEGFLKAWQGMQKRIPDLAPAECLVIEDSIAGVTAAKAAGMACLAVTTSYPSAKLEQADWIAPGVAEWFREL